MCLKTIMWKILIHKTKMTHISHNFLVSTNQNTSIILDIRYFIYWVSNFIITFFPWGNIDYFCIIAGNFLNRIILVDKLNKTLFSSNFFLQIFAGILR